MVSFAYSTPAELKKGGCLNGYRSLHSRSLDAVEQIQENCGRCIDSLMQFAVQ